MILAGDIGGTKCNIALVEPADGSLTTQVAAEPRAGAFRISFLRRYPSQKYAYFADVINEFLQDARQILEASPARKVLAAGLGVAGPVIGHKVHVTNVGWNVDATALENQLDTPHVVLLNDLEATGYSLHWLDPSDLISLNPGTPAAQAPRALIAAGTGLGEASLHWCNGRYVVSPSEGGHADFAPRTDQEIELLRDMKKTNKCVSNELILSGRGFLTIHKFLNDAVQHASFEDPDVDPAQEITRRGLEGSCRVCTQTLDLWAALYGAEAGNLALRTLARGGVFVAGGIGPKILPKMTDGTFVRAFREKEKFEELLATLPVQLVLNQDAPLLGAAGEAARVLAAGNVTQQRA